MRRWPKGRAEAEALKLLERVGIPEQAHKYPGQLSGGQQQRIAVARALVFEPDLVLMDEPLGALDKQLREQMQYEIKHIHERLGVTIVYVTHDQSEALTMSNRIAVFNDGVVQQLSGFLTTLPGGPWAYLGVTILVFLILGCVLEGLPWQGAPADQPGTI